MKAFKDITWFYKLGIGIGIIVVVSFTISQIIFPIVIGKPDSIQIPNVVGLEILTAKRVLTDKKLHVIVRDSVWTEEFKTGCVAEQKPRAGEAIKPDGSVYIVVSKGSKTLEMPNVIGMEYQDAYFTLRTAGLRVVVADSVYSSQFMANTVMRTYPTPGSAVERNKFVQIYLSKGEEIKPDSLKENYFY